MQHKPNIYRTGDWVCDGCNQLNFASRRQCYNCSAKKKPEKKKGDWNCDCGTMNFASRSCCYKCGKNNTNSLPITLQMNPDVNLVQTTSSRRFPNDWVCACGTINFAIRSACFKCQKTKSDEVITTSHSSDSPPNENCIICMDRPADTLISPCGHLGFCNLCSLSMNKCPVCRTSYDPDTQLIKVYKV